MVYAKPDISPGKRDTHIPLGYWQQDGSLNLGQTSRPYNNQQKMGICEIEDFAVPVDYRVKKRLIKGLEDLEIRRWMKLVQTNTLSRSVRILRRVLETWRELLSLKLQWKTIS